MKRNHDPILNELLVNAKDRKYQLWERNPFAIELYSDEVIWQKLEYIHNNPCNPKWNLASRPEDYKWASAANYILNRDDWGFISNIMGDERG